MNRIWSDSERQYIRDNADTMKDADLAAKLSAATGRTISLQAVRKQRQKLGVAKKPGRGVCGVKKEEDK